MGKHTNQHRSLGEILQDAEGHATDIYRKWHNGDVEANDLVMANRDTIKKARAKLETHIEMTEGDDRKVELYDKWSKLLWIIIPTLAGFILREIYNFIM